MNEPRYKIGDVVYVGTYDNRQSQIECPVCFGKREVTLILGNGDSVITPCDYCGKGHEGPKGFVLQCERIPRAEAALINEIRLELSADGSIVQYHTANYSCYQEYEVFPTQAEAMAYAQELADKAVKEESERAEYIKNNQAKSYSWNAGYYLRKAKQARDDAEYHERMAVRCKAKAKGESKS